MAASFIKPRKSRYSTKVFFYYHNGLKKHKRADINNKHSETIKTLYLKDITKEYLQDRINTFKINDKTSNKKTSAIWNLTPSLMPISYSVTIF